MRYYARAFPPAGGSPRGPGYLFNSIVRARDWYLAQPRLKFEGITVGLALLAGLLAMPALIYLAGRIALREYQNGGLFALYFDFFKGLVDLRESCWIAMAGPLIFLSLYRLFALLLRKL
jgi:hypothetical protein